MPSLHCTRLVNAAACAPFAAAAPSAVGGARGKARSRDSEDAQPKVMTKPLFVGDRVSVLGTDCRSLGKLKKEHPMDWKTFRVYGHVRTFNAEEQEWRVEFDDGSIWHGNEDHISFVGRYGREAPVLAPSADGDVVSAVFAAGGKKRSRDAALPPLLDGDRVSVLGSECCDRRALVAEHPSDWRTIRFYGNVIRFNADKDKYNVVFDGGSTWHGRREQISFVSRAKEKGGRAASTSAAAVRVGDYTGGTSQTVPELTPRQFILEQEGLNSRSYKEELEIFDRLPDADKKSDDASAWLTAHILAMPVGGAKSLAFEVRAQPSAQQHSVWVKDCELTVGFCELTVGFCELTAAFCELTEAYCELTEAY